MTASAGNDSPSASTATQTLATSGADAPYKQRFRVEVQSPTAWLNLGEGGATGYRGASLGSTENLFFSAGGKALYQAMQDVTHVTMKKWFQISYDDLLVGSGKHAMLATKRQIVLHAGGGYTPDVQLENGVEPPMMYWNPTDYQEVIEPCRDALRWYDDNFDARYEAYRVALGFPETPEADGGPPPLAGRLERMKAAVSAALFGTPLPPTENSESIEQFMRKLSGLVGLVDKAARLANRVERLAARPETAGRLGKVVDIAKDLRPLVSGLMDAIETSTKLVGSMQGQSDPDSRGIRDEYGEELREQKDKAHVAAGGTGASWTKKGKAAADLGGLGLTHLLRPIANRARKLAATLATLSRGLTTVAGLLDILPKPSSAIGLVGKDGVSVITPRRMFGFASDGFHFVSILPECPAPPGDPNSFVGKAMALKDKAVALLEGPTPRPELRPRFWVTTSGDIRLRSEDDIEIAATEGDSRIALRAGSAAELSAVGPVGLTSRTGTTEVLGRKVVLGTPALDTAKAAAKKALALASLEASAKKATSTAEASAKKLRKARKKYDAAKRRSQREEAEVGGPRMLSMLAAHAASEDEAERVLLKQQYKLAKAEAEATENLRRLVVEKLDAARAQAAIAIETSEIADAMEWQPKSQALADTIQAAAVDTVSVYGGTKVSLESTKSIEIATEPKVAKRATVTLTEQVEIKVGNFSVVVSDKKVTISGVGASTLTVDSKGVTVDAGNGGGSIKVAATGLTMNGRACNLTGDVIKLG